MNERNGTSLNEMTFTPRLSRWITGMYWSIFAFLAFMLVAMPFLVKMSSWEKVLFQGTFLAVLAMFIFIMLKAYRMRFTIEKDRIIVSGVFKENRIEISDIKSIDKGPIPAGIRIFGASFLGGLYYLPGIGRAWVSMGNFQDGVLISTKKGKHYVITPRKPLKFIEIVKKKME